MSVRVLLTAVGVRLSENRAGMLHPFPPVLDGDVGVWVPERTARSGLATGPPPPRTVLDAPGLAAGGTTDGTAAILPHPLSRPWRA